MEEQFTAFVTGFNELIPPDLVNVFDARELELLIGGIADIDVEDWKKHTDYRGYTEQDEVIKNFWTVSLSHCTTCGQSANVWHVVHSKLGCGTEVAIIAICNRHISYPCQRLQRSSRERWASTLHHREVGLR